MSEGKISPHEAQELDACFRAGASDLFGHACAVIWGDQALSRDLVQAAFEAAALAWRGLRGRAQEQQHAAALLRWGLDMKEGEIAAVLGIAEKTVSVHLYRIRRKLLLQLGADRPFDDDAGEGASP